jgi:hypothetical protein
MQLNWSKGRGASSVDDIKEFENAHEIEFPQKYKDIAIESNGGYPEKNIFDAGSRKECVFEALLNWDKSKKANIYFWVDVVDVPKIIPFGRDPFGNVICFDFSNSQDPKITFWDHEIGNFTFVSENFDLFLELLR